MKKFDLAIVTAVVVGVAAGLLFMNIKQKREAQLAKVPGAASTDHA